MRVAWSYVQQKRLPLARKSHGTGAESGRRRSPFSPASTQSITALLDGASPTGDSAQARGSLPEIGRDQPFSDIRRRYPRRAHIAVHDMEFEPPQTALLTSDGSGLDNELSVHREIVHATIEVQRCAKTLSTNG